MDGGLPDPELLMRGLRDSPVGRLDLENLLGAVAAVAIASFAAVISIIFLRRRFFDPTPLRLVTWIAYATAAGLLHIPGNFGGVRFEGPLVILLLCVGLAVFLRRRATADSTTLLGHVASVCVALFFTEILGFAQSVPRLSISLRHWANLLVHAVPLVFIPGLTALMASRLGSVRARPAAATWVITGLSSLLALAPLGAFLAFRAGALWLTRASPPPGPHNFVPDWSRGLDAAPLAVILTGLTVWTVLMASAQAAPEGSAAAATWPSEARVFRWPIVRSLVEGRTSALAGGSLIAALISVAICGWVLTW